MKWPKGRVGVLLGAGAAVLVAAVLWAVVASVGDDGAVREAPGGLPSGSSTASLPAGAAGTIPATRTDAVTSDAVAPGGPGSGSAPRSGGPEVPPDTKTAFTESQARQVLATFLGHIGQGRPAEARAMTTESFASGVGPEFFDRVSDPISVVEVIMATREDGRWTVYCGEVWRTGPRQTRYSLVETGGKLLVDGFELADLP